MTIWKLPHTTYLWVTSRHPLLWIRISVEPSNGRAKTFADWVWNSEYIVVLWQVIKCEVEDIGKQKAPVIFVQIPGSQCLARKLEIHLVSRTWNLRTGKVWAPKGSEGNVRSANTAKQNDPLWVRVSAWFSSQNLHNNRECNNRNLVAMLPTASEIKLLPFLF